MGRHRARRRDPGEYTQLTGRAGRRGIDVEGHAVVVDHAGLDPVHLAGLASKRLYPLRSSFRPTYNMAVNLVAQVGRDRAREVLETSFAQFQADRGVVGLAKQAQAHAEALDGYAQAMTCNRGDFAEYAALRRRITARGGTCRAPRAGRAAPRSSPRSSACGPGTSSRCRPGGARATSSCSTRGGRRVRRPAPHRPHAGPPGEEAHRRRRTRRDPHRRARAHPQDVQRARPAQRRDLASTLRNALGALDEPGTRPGRTTRARSGATDDAQLARLRAQLRAHPCHDCPDREDHARWAERWARLKKEHDQLVRRVEGRTAPSRASSTASATSSSRSATSRPPSPRRTRPRPRGRPGRGGDPGAPPTGRAAREAARTGLQVTPDGQWLRRLYAENDLLLAECLRRGVWEDLDAPALAAVVSTCVHAGRREDHGEPDVPGGPTAGWRARSRPPRACGRRSTTSEDEHDIDATGPLDEGLVTAVHRWAVGRSLDAVLRGSEIAAGDFVRWCKQVIDVLDQVAGAAPTPRSAAPHARRSTACAAASSPSPASERAAAPVAPSAGGARGVSRGRLGGPALEPAGVTCTTRARTCADAATGR